MVLYFGEREAHNRTKQELAELRAAMRQGDAEQWAAPPQYDAEQREFMQQQAEINRIMLDTLRLLVAEVRELRAQRNDSGNGNPETAPP